MIGTSAQQLRYDNLDVSALTEEEKRELQVLLAEADNRNLEIPVEVVNKSLYRFPRDSSGYFIKSDGGKYRATEAHAGFLASNARFVLFYGSRGAGKSAAGAQKALDKISQGFDGTIINPTFEDLKTSTWEEFRKWIPPEAVIPKHRYRLSPEWEAMRPFTLTFMNGAKVYIKGLKDPDSARGANVNWLWYDEGGSDLDGRGWRIAIAAVRVGKDPQAWVTSTPNGILHWMYDFFLDEEKIKQFSEMEEFKNSDRKFVESFHGTMDQNKQNLDPTFYAAMSISYDGWERTQEIDGEFVSQGGTLGDARWFDKKIFGDFPTDISIQNRVRYWDLAASEKKVGTDPDETVGTLFSWAKYEYNQEVFESGHFGETPIGEDLYFVENQVGGFWKWDDIKENIWKTALEDGYFVKIYIEQEPGSGGKNQIAELQSFISTRCIEAGLPPFVVKGHPPEGDKVMRANIWFAESRKGQVYIKNGLWNKLLLKQVDGFPILTHDDRVDSISGARMVCAPIRTWKKIAFLKV